jgi:hypothetical protein
MTKYPYGEQRPKFETPNAEGEDFQHPGVDSIKHAQQQAFLEIALKVASHDMDFIATIQAAIHADEFLGGPFYTKIEAISPGISPQIGEYMDQLIAASAERHSAWTSSGFASPDSSNSS